jgi:hypothetical protein
MQWRKSASDYGLLARGKPGHRVGDALGDLLIGDHLGWTVPNSAIQWNSQIPPECAAKGTDASRQIACM